MIHYKVRGDANDNRGWSRLDLCFYGDGKHPLLADFGYWHKNGSGRNYLLVNKAQRGKYLRSLCIFILLAKYRSEIMPKVQTNFHLREKVLKNSWLATLGSTFGDASRIEFFNKYFDTNSFVTVSRGSGHTAQMKATGAGEAASATYILNALKLENVRCFTVPRFEKDPTAKLLEGKELTQMAKDLENYWVPVKPEKMGEVARSIKQKWDSTVEGFIQDIESGRANDNLPKTEEPTLNNTDSKLPYTLSARWRDLGEYVKQQMSAGNLGGDWYVMSVTLTWLLEWDETFLNAVKRDGARVRIVRHAPDAGQCRGVRSQWDMYFKNQAGKGRSGADYVRMKILETKKIVQGWAADVKAAKKQSKNVGSLEFFESKIPHPFMAVLHVPKAKRQVSGPAWGAPDGTKCMIGLYSMYPDGLEERCGLFLHDPSPMLDLYYKSVIRFFELAEDDGYMKPG